SARDRRLGGHVVRLPAVAVESIGAGGGSVAWVDDVGALRVGPRSAGAVPGPAAYGRGGVEPTVTDADVVLGLAGGVGGGLELNEELAREACARLGSQLGLSADDAARATAEVAHAGIERVLVPALSSTFSALGCCLSELAIEDVRTCLARLDEADWPRIERELEGLVGEISGTLENGRGALRVARSLELRYRDQNDAL